MKKLIIASLLFISATAIASPTITLTLSDEMETGNTKVCLYSNANYDFTYEVSASEHCPFTKTFDVDD